MRTEPLIRVSSCLQKGTFEQLYMSFCELHGLPRTAVTMSLDGKVFSPKDCVGDNVSDYLIEAKVDFSKQIESKKKRYLRLRLVVFGRRSEIYKIDSVRATRNLIVSLSVSVVNRPVPI